jgi:hypothetical protein
VTFTHVQYILIRFAPTVILSHPHYLLLTTISTSLIVLFSYTNTKHIHRIYPPLPTLFIFPLPAGIHLHTGLVLTVCPSFFKMCINFSRAFYLGISDMCMLCLNHLNPFYHLHSLCSPAPLLLSSLQCIALY